MDEVRPSIWRRIEAETSMTRSTSRAPSTTFSWHYRRAQVPVVPCNDAIAQETPQPTSRALSSLLDRPGPSLNSPRNHLDGTIPLARLPERVILIESTNAHRTTSLRVNGLPEKLHVLGFLNKLRQETAVGAMRFTGALLLAAMPAALAAQPQQVRLARPTSAMEGGTPSSIVSTSQSANYTEIITQAPRSLPTIAAEKPAFEASVMGLVVFSAAGLFLL
ncbi:hypothetical protein F4780DRAFT_93850 [Xylariomycetidae sp. FL0641]|nr:hypothetical protein F4780DRAFT_93850 [Xylariomycetidae sp. FL0641]